MSCPENTSEKIIRLLSAFELEDAMEHVAEIVMAAAAASGAAVLMWDTDLEAIADRMFFGEQQKELRALADALTESYENYEFAAEGGDLKVEDLADLEELDLSAALWKNLGSVYLVTIAHGGERRAIVLTAGDDLASGEAVHEALTPFPLGLVLSKGWEVKELQRENERLRSQYEEIEDKTSNMEEQTRKLIHDITARDSIRMKQLERERLVYWISNAVRSSVHIKEVLDMTVEKIGNTFGVSRCMLLRADDRIARLDVFEFTREGEASVKDLLYSPAGRDFTKQALSRSSPEHIEDPTFSDNSTFDRQFLCSLNLRSGLTVPLVMRDSILGVLFLQDTDATRDWSIDDISLIGSLADNLSVAIENAELHQERERQAVTDGLTGVYNRRAFTENLEKEFERAVRHEQTLSLIIIDLDFLKKINDNFGHMAGDEAIRAIGQVLRQSSRSIDFCARYGGEEFCLLLPNTEIDMAEQLAERLRRLINEVTIEGYGNISASLGVASYPLHCQSADELFHKADEALYKAKQGGRNCVYIAAPLGGPDDNGSAASAPTASSAAESDSVELPL
jgi:diguanylate cyclase (GGDEF)-like protein